MIEKVKSTILEIVNKYPGTDGVNLVLILAERIASEEVANCSKTVSEIVEELINAGQLIAVDYILPTYLYKDKGYTRTSRLYPKGTKIVIWDALNN